MPKELIHNAYFGQTAKVRTFRDGDEQKEVFVDELVDSSAVKVGWTRGYDHAELAVVCNADAPGDTQARHIQLDRAGINQLIRVLRKARDQAFGSDA